MQITATQISDWATTKGAQASLPRLIRRLVHTASTPTLVDFPAGDSTSLPGWDGEVVSKHGSPWVLEGRSFWESSCDAQVTKKANKDYNKRTQQTPVTLRPSASLIIVSARKWSKKKRWLEEKRRIGRWAEVRAYDANDLEQWLEQSPAVALQFSEELGLTSHSVESIEKRWEGWSQQSSPPISDEALFIDRDNTRERLIADLNRLLETGQPELYTIKADSVDEATAFVCAALRTHPDLGVVSLVVNESTGWQFVAKNTALKIAVAVRPEMAEKPTRRNGLVVIIPYATGDMASHYRGVAGRDSDANITLERPHIQEFEKALTSIGLDEADATRLAGSTGRSWSVLRRRLAINPAIRRPTWLDVPQASFLATLCLLGGWSTEKNADREIVARLSGHPYEEIERGLQYLARLDDAPVLQIGAVWKAKSPLELLDLFGDRITHDEFDRFFEIVQSILSAPDPELDLPDEKRHAAKIYGKVRPQSYILVETLCDTLIKLAVRGPYVTALGTTNVKGRVDALLYDLLNEADCTRWLSLSPFLPALAEAAPDTFLNTVEGSLAKPDMPVTRLLTETSGSGIMGRCWHADLLWALETLAWAPERLTRVALILARLAHIEIKGNWGNTPMSSLLGIFRSWFPQTAADLDQRIAVLDTLISKEPDVPFDLLDGLLHVGPDTATPSARPKWRDEDTGAGHGVTRKEQHEMVVAAADRLISCADGHPKRIARLIEKISIFDPIRVKTTLMLADQPSFSDEDKEVIRIALRRKIYLHRNYGKDGVKTLDDELQNIEEVYERLSPKDLVVRHRWLFTDGWPDLPVRFRDDDYSKRGGLLDSLRTNALREIYDERGMTGILKLAADCANQPYVGVSLTSIEIEKTDLTAWIVEEKCDFSSGHPLTMTIRGLLRTLADPQSTELIRAVLEKGNSLGWDAEQTARFLVLAREERATWDIVASVSAEVENSYWSKTNPGFLLRNEGNDFEFALRRLLEAGRPRTALQVCHLDFDKVDPKLLVEMFEHMLKGEESEGPLLHSWDIGKAIEQLEASEVIERDRLVRLEFGLIPALGYEGEQQAESLYNAIMSDPKLFTELLCILYKPASGEREIPLSESAKAAAEVAWHILHYCRRQPGTQLDGTVDRDAFIKFIDDARALCREADRLAVCDSTLGQILAHASADSDGVWPSEPARDVLDRPELQKMRNGFQIGTRNKRGVTSRSYGEGGDQERILADKYRKYARALQSSHPNLAGALEDIACDYEREGLHEDLEAKLCLEGY